MRGFVSNNDMTSVYFNLTDKESLIEILKQLTACGAQGMGLGHRLSRRMCWSACDRDDDGAAERYQRGVNDS